MHRLSLRQVLGFYGLLGAFALLGVTAAGSPVALWSPSRPMLLAVAAGIGAGLVAVALSQWLVRRFRWASVLNEEFRLLLGELSVGRALVIAVASGVVEELLFRGLLLDLLGFVGSSVLFGVVHIGPNRRFAPWTVMALVAGFAFGGLAIWSGGLLAPILAHVTINFLNLRTLGKRDLAPEVALEPFRGRGIVG